MITLCRPKLQEKREQQLSPPTHVTRPEACRWHYCRRAFRGVPGEEVVLQLSFFMPADYRQAPWYLDLVNEYYFWFSGRGSAQAKVDFADGAARAAG
jgi:hypothetical protein